ncbi:hypothetical protein [Ekhidna sp.]
MKRVCLTIVILTLISCSESPELNGLWVLKEVSVDMIPRDSKPLYVHFTPDGNFSVSRAEGDLVGLFQLNGNNLSFESVDQKWFSTKWSANIYRENLVLKGLEYGFRTTELRFSKAEKFPTFDEFIEEVNGKWELYKIDNKNNIESIKNTHFIIDEDTYSIVSNDSTIEKGAVLIDSRHEKISFEYEETTWNVRFVWSELRLDNNEMNITYRLRRVDD